MKVSCKAPSWLACAAASSAAALSSAALRAPKSYKTQLRETLSDRTDSRCLELSAGNPAILVAVFSRMSCHEPDRVGRYAALATPTPSVCILIVAHASRVLGLLHKARSMASLRLSGLPTAPNTQISCRPSDSSMAPAITGGTARSVRKISTASAVAAAHHSGSPSSAARKIVEALPQSTLTHAL